VHPSEAGHHSKMPWATGVGKWLVFWSNVERAFDRGQAAALGLMTRVEELTTADPPTRRELADAFRGACHGGQRRMAEFLLDLGADVNGTPSWGDDSTPLDAADSMDTDREALLTWLRERGATKSTDAGAWRSPASHPAFEGSDSPPT
jgi:hypothetical protein